MIILGIDPGTVSMGYGVIESRDDEITLVDYGAFKCSPRTPTEKRLGFLYARLLEIINRHKPDMVAVEEPFVSENVKSALAIGRAQAIAILAAVNNDVPISRYTPAEVKRQITNYGASSKEQIQEMIKLTLGLSQVPQPSDAADALAVAICHVQALHLKSLLSRQSEGSQ
ncbi:MAG: crossover junction endodeoxyribonuclease RuvC [Chloroflexota bacterium]